MLVNDELSKLNTKDIVEDLYNNSEIDYSKVMKFDYNGYKRNYNIEDLELAIFNNAIIPFYIDEKEEEIVFYLGLYDIIDMEMNKSGNIKEEFNEHKKTFPIIKPEFREQETASVVKLKTGEYATIKNNGEILK